MLSHPTLDQLRALKLDGMAQAFVELEAQEDVGNCQRAPKSPRMWAFKIP